MGSGAGALFDKALALAALVAKVAQSKKDRWSELVVPGGMWGDVRLEQVAARARAWLECVGEGEEEQASGLDR